MAVDPYDPAVNPVVRATRNRNNFPPEELKKYENQWVAWSSDGTRIIAAADDLDPLEEAVNAAGFKISDTVVELILPADLAFLGGATCDLTTDDSA